MVTKSKVDQILDSTSAGKLFRILTKARECSGGAPAFHCWANVFGLENTDTAEILLHLKGLIDLVNRCECELGQITELEPEYYSSTFAEIRKYITESATSLNVQFDVFKQRVTDSLLSSLNFTAKFLSNANKTFEIPIDEIDQFVERLDEFSSDIDSSNLDERLKSRLKKLLFKISEDLRRYKYFGGTFLEDDFKQLIGESIISEKELTKKESVKFKDKMWKFVVAFNTLISLGNNGLKLLTDVHSIFQKQLEIPNTIQDQEAVSDVRLTLQTENEPFSRERNTV
jgi:hypothetical protein